MRTGSCGWRESHGRVSSIERDRRAHPDVGAERLQVVEQPLAGALEQPVGGGLVVPADERLAEPARVLQVVRQRELDELSELVDVRVGTSDADERRERLGVAAAVPEPQRTDDRIFTLGANDPECHVSVSVSGRGERALGRLVRVLCVPGIPGDERDGVRLDDAHVEAAAPCAGVRRTRRASAT